jgi:NAD(P)-dependent dehydrogenase (short-subunit alcohol dehydrogenase family)
VTLRKKEIESILNNYPYASNNLENEEIYINAQRQNKKHRVLGDKQMKEFRDKVAVITGAASGIGRGITDRCAQEGMKVVLADIEEPALTKVEQELKSADIDVLAVRTDVSKEADIKNLAEKTLDRFGAVHLLFNNAGVAAGSTVWESSLVDWQWVMGVNLWGVIYGVRVFVPIMLAQDTDCYIVNTSSAAGLLSNNTNSVYEVTKHAVVALSEHMYYSLAQKKANIKVSVLCPGWVKTRILECDRNRPAELSNTQPKLPLTQEAEAAIQYITQAVASGISPQAVADRVFEAIRSEQFYILTDSKSIPMIQKRMENILNQRNPS